MSLEDKIFANHYQYYQNIGIETIKQQAGQVEQVSSDYQGRVIYELLQNAFDKADQNILVEVKGDCLYIANDGTKFTYNANHDYKDGETEHENFTRYDFQSLCSISTSTKTASESIGNKGVGFKSVFSLAKGGFVNVYTKGIMIDNGESVDETISFGIYDTLKEEDCIPDGFNLEVKQTIKKQIKQVQQERKERGVPGYYYPLHISKEPQLIEDYFAQGFVTVIEIPFDNIEKVELLFEEIEKIHFNFVSLKYDKPFQIDFRLNGCPFQKKIEANNGLFFSTPIKKEAIEHLAKDAGVQIGDNNKVAICFKSSEDIERGEQGLLYNYLPTKQKSPFKYVDFHADFHTSVDRKSIEFDGKSKIGRYNAALLKACVELYFSLINSALSESERCKLNIESIQLTTPNIFKFNWSYLDLSFSNAIYHMTRDILGIDDNINQWNHNDRKRYETAVELIAGLANQCFKQNEIQEGERVLFVKTIMQFIHAFTNDYKMQYSRSAIFKAELADQLLNKQVQLLPNISLSRDVEILYKEKDNESVTLPAFMGINVTSFQIQDNYFSNCLGIKKYSDINVLFKYFRQVDIRGGISKERLNPSLQIQLLKSLFHLFKNKKEKIEWFAHRYESFLSETDRKNYSAQNITAFSVSTVFLKTNGNKYKPAQLCNQYELDEAFLSNFIDNIDYRAGFLRFLGVSTEKNYLVVDKKIYDQFKQGIDFIPAPFTRKETENLTAKEIIPNIRVITSKKAIHPAIINFNRYRFLEDISNTKFRKQLAPLKVGEYGVFPNEYRHELLNVIEKELERNPHDVFRLYSANLFYLLHGIGKYLVVNQSNYYWSDNAEFKIAQNRNDFELLKTQPVPVLCFFHGKEIPESLAHNKIELKPYDVELNNEKDISSEFKLEYEKYIPFILAEISYLGNHISERDYLKELSEVIDFQNIWNNLRIKSGNKLRALYLYDKDNEAISISQKTCYSDKTKTLYFDNAISKSEKAAAIANHIFNVGSLDSKIELVFFHKELEDLCLEYNQQDIKLISSKWLPDYENKFKSFQDEILDHFNLSQYYNTLWYIYSEANRSEVLVKLDREGRINELEQLVINCKQKEEYKEYFENFQIKIDRSHIESKISKLLITIEKFDIEKNRVDELKYLSTRLGVEDRLSEIELEIQVQYPSSENEKHLNKAVAAKRKEIELKNKIENIFDKIHFSKHKKVICTDLSGSYSSENLPIKKKKIVFKGQTFPDSKALETMGATGEEEVLLYFINEFISIKNVEERKQALERVYILLKAKIGDDSHEKYKEACVKAVSDVEALQKALIPFFYVTMHHKFSFFDLIVYYGGQATLVEVKTTKNNKNFYLSIAEVEAARGDDNYIIVRNTSDCIDILGNPIKDIEDKISYIQGDKFILTPRNYQFELRNN